MLVAMLLGMDYDLWLDPKQHKAATVQPLLKSFPSELLTVYPVNAKAHTPTCIEPVA